MKINRKFPLLIQERNSMAPDEANIFLCAAKKIVCADKNTKTDNKGAGVNICAVRRSRHPAETDEDISSPVFFFP